MSLTVCEVAGRQRGVSEADRQKIGHGMITEDVVLADVAVWGEQACLRLQ